MEDGVLLPYQKRWVADKSQVKVAEKSRRIGLSWAEAADDVLTASLGKADGGMDVWYIGYNKEMAIGFIRDCAFWARNFNMAAVESEEEIFRDEDKDILMYKLTFASGFRITALSSRPSNLRSRQGKVVIDEAAFHDDLPELLKAAFALLMWGGRVVIISTHNGIDNPFNELIEDIRAGKKPGYSLHRVDLNDALAEGFYQRICLTTGKPYSKEAENTWKAKLIAVYGSGADEELFCIPSAGSGNYFSSAIVSSRMSAELPVIRLAKSSTFEEVPEAVRVEEILTWCEVELKPYLDKLDDNLSSVLGEDFGRDADLTVLAPLVELRSLKRITPFIVELRNVPFKQQEQIVFYIIDRLPGFRCGAFDARGNGQYLAEVARLKYGSDVIFDIKATREWYRENMPKYKAALQEDDITLPKDSDILGDHRMIILDKGVPMVPDKHSKGSDGLPRHGDSVIALCMAWFASTQDVVPIPRKVTRRFRRLFS